MRGDRQSESARLGDIEGPLAPFGVMRLRLEGDARTDFDIAGGERRRAGIRR